VDTLLSALPVLARCDVCAADGWDLCGVSGCCGLVGVSGDW
jgi:hypothetical protein